MATKLKSLQDAVSLEAAKILHMESDTRVPRETIAALWAEYHESFAVLERLGEGLPHQLTGRAQA